MQRKQQERHNGDVDLSSPPRRLREDGDEPPAPASWFLRPTAGEFRGRATTSPGARSDRSDKSVARSHTSSSHQALSTVGNLTAGQVAVLRKSWRHINTKGLNSVVQRIFHKLECRCPSVAEAFSKPALLAPTTDPVADVCTVNEHAKLFIATLDELLENLDNKKFKWEVVRSQGAKHHQLREKCAFKADVWERFGEICAETVLKLDGVQQNKEATKAWRILLACITDEMRYGFEQEVKQEQRRCSYNDVMSRHRIGGPGGSNSTSALVTLVGSTFLAAPNVAGAFAGVGGSSRPRSKSGHDAYLIDDVQRVRDANDGAGDAVVVERH